MLTAEYTVPGLHIREHVEPVPLDWAHPDGDSIEVFAREVVAPTKRAEDLPLLLFLQGGPGGKSPRPTDASGWLGVALERFRVVLLDQRGTGRSSRVDGERMRALESGERGADLLAHFRADSIVRDAEHLRRTVYSGRRWSTLGQSYGGFITLTYLSKAPEGLAACYVTGGLAGLAPDAAEVYRRCFDRAVVRNRRYAERYPQDVDRIARIADVLASGEVRLPDGSPASVRRFQWLGQGFGMKPGFEEHHWLVDEAFAGDRLTEHFLHELYASTSFADDPLYAAVHESIYADPASGATAWAAQAERDRRPEFGEGARPLLFTPETVFPWLFDEVRLLQPFAAAAEALARRTEWGALYDRARLAANEVPVAAAVYFDDLYVPADLSLETADAVGGLQRWVTDEYDHDGLRQDDRVLKRLLELVDERGGPLPAAP